METRDYRDYPDESYSTRRREPSDNRGGQQSRSGYTPNERYRDADYQQDEVSYRQAGSGSRPARRPSGSARTGTSRYRSENAYRGSTQSTRVSSYRGDGYQRSARTSYDQEYAPHSRDRVSAESRQRYSAQSSNGRQRATYDDYRQEEDYAPRPARPRNSRDVYAGRTPSSGNRGGQRGSSPLDNPWIQRGIILAAIILVLVILVNVVSCIGGAIAPQQAESSSEATATENITESSSGSTSESSSTAAAQEGVVSPWTDSGYFSTGDAALDNYIKKVCDENSTEGESFDKNAYNTNIYISRTDYVERENNQSPWGPDWDVEYARQFFEENNSGNCYNFAAVTQFVLQYFGYSDAEAQPCIVELESGNWGDHGLVFVTNKLDGKQSIVDDALSADGWMLDINAYNYDVRNIAQNATVKGNTDALDDDDNPTPIAPGELTE